MVSELFLQEARPIAVGIATIVNWFANFTVGLTFPYILVSTLKFEPLKLQIFVTCIIFAEIPLSVWDQCVCGDV